MVALLAALLLGETFPTSMTARQGKSLDGGFTAWAVDCVNCSGGAGASGTTVDIRDAGPPHNINPPASLPLPTGASTAAKQPALGTAGSASADVISVQGLASMTPLTTAASLSSRSDTFTTTGNGVTVTATTTPFKSYSVQVKGTGAVPTSWDVRLEGSLNNSTFTSILTHTDTTGDGVVLYSGSGMAPSLYFRARVAALSLGSATNVVVTILGVQ